MVELVLPILVFASVMGVGGAVLSARWSRHAPVRRRIRAMTGSADHAEADQEQRWRHIGRIAELTPAGRPSPKLQKQLTEAGYHSRDSASIFIGAKMVLLLGGLVGTGVLLMPTDLGMALKVLLVMVISGSLFFVPNLIVTLKRRQRCNEVRMNLPNALDLLEICVSSGMGLDMAWNAVTDEVRGVSAVLADEMSLTSLEIHLGATRAVSMRHMANRTDSQEIRSLVAILVQSERFGTSIAEALRTFAKSMREERSQRAEEAAERMAVKLLFPMIVFIFPVVIIVAAGPAGIILVRTLGGG